ncbi:MAG: hypothetical protein ACPGVH_06530 [Chitinophagales bacterium]
MNFIKIVFLFLLVFIGGETLQAQNKKLDKETKKQLKAFMKNPASYRRIERENKEKLEEADFKVAVLEERYDELKVLNRIYYDSITELNAYIRELEARDNAIKAAIEENLALEYRVQIGAYSRNDFGGATSMGKAIRTDVVNGVTKYYVGSFDSPYDAQDFADAIRSMGLDGAFVTKFVDGQRVPFDIKDLL